MSAEPVLVQTPDAGLVQIATADASNLKTVATGAAAGTKVVSLIATSTETANAREVKVSRVRSGTEYPLATTNVPANSGLVASAAPVDLLAVLKNANMLPVDNDGQPYLFLKNGDTLTVAALTTLASGKLISVHADHGHF